MNGTSKILLGVIAVIAAGLLVFFFVHRAPSGGIATNTAPNATATVPGSTTGSQTTTASMVADPGAPHGLFVAMFPSTYASGDYPAIQQYLVNNPTVSGADIFIEWSAVDKGPSANPQYDWSSVDADMQPWVAAGKTVNFIVWAVGDGGQNHFTPSYVLSTVNTVSCDNGDKGPYPVYWQANYMTAYQKFMAAVVAQYGSDPSVGYIRFGIGQGGETSITCIPEFTSDYGLSASVWENYIFKMVDYEASLHSPKQIVVAANSLPFGTTPYEVADAVSAHAAADGIGFGNQGLQETDITNYNSGGVCNGDWCGNFNKFAGQVPLYLQTLYASTPSGVANVQPGTVGSLVDLVPFAITRHTQILELFYQDWLTAYDPNMPGYAEYHTAYQQMFTTAAKEIGNN